MADGISTSARDNIDAIVKLEEDFENRRSLGDRIADTITEVVGTVVFVAAHLVAFAGWVAVNTGRLGLPAFDPFPYTLFTLMVSFEGVLITIFVLIKQNRMALRADQRAHLDLQVNLLTEQEVTKLIQMVAQIGTKLGVGDRLVDDQTRELGQTTAVGDMAAELERKLAGDQA